MGPNVIIRRDNSGSVTVEITFSAEQSDALVAFLTVAASAIQGGSLDIGKSPEANATPPSTHATEPRPIDPAVAAMADRRRRHRLLQRHVRQVRANPLNSRPLDQIIADAALALDFDPDQARLVIRALEKKLRSKLKRRRNREILRLRETECSQSRIAQRLAARRVYGPVSASTVSRVLRDADLVAVDGVTSFLSSLGSVPAADAGDLS